MVVPEMGKPMAESACVRCGHCVDVCPVGAIYMQEHKDEVLYMTHSYDCDTVAQLSEDVIPELTELFKVKKGEISMNQVCTALHKIGFDKVVSDGYAKAEAAKQAAEIIEKKISREPVILTNSHAVINFVDRYFADMKGMIDVYDSAQTVFGKAAGEGNALGFDKPVKTVNITKVKEMGAEAKETGNVDYVWNARELYRVFLRTGGAPHKKGATAFDTIGADSAMPYPELLGEKDWTLTSDVEEVAILVDGKPYKCAVAHNLGQVRKLLEGEYKNYDAVRLMA